MTVPFKHYDVRYFKLYLINNELLLIKKNNVFLHLEKDSNNY